MASQLAVAGPLGPETEVAGVEDEVKRLLARELHDRVAQTLTGMLVDVENFKAEQVGWSDVVRELDSIQGATRQVLTSIRELLHDLRSDQLFEDSFVDAVGKLARRTEDRTGIKTTLDVGDAWPEELGGHAGLNLYRMLEEALANVRLHSGAQNVRIHLGERSEDELEVTVMDDGRGLDTDPSRPMGFGTLGMRERAVLLGGKVAIESETGRGTTVRVLIPRKSTDLIGPPGTVANERRSE